MGLIGRKVIRNTDDSPCPAVGVIVARLDEDRVEVVWDVLFDGAPDPATLEGRAEWIEDLTPRG